MIDPRKFLGAGGRETALYLGGDHLHLRQRAVSWARPAGAADPAPGFYAAQVKGRRATIEGPADPFDLADLPAEVGHYAAGYVALERGRVEALERLGAAEPEPLAPLRARRHRSGALLLAEPLFEGEAEVEARERLVARRGLADVRGVGATLRAAFAVATAAAVARELEVPFSPLEALGLLFPIAEQGPDAARELMGALSARRAAERAAADERARAARLREVGRYVARAGARARADDHRRDPAERAERALRSAGAELLATRDLGGQLEVRFRFRGERFVSIVDPVTLHVFDAGVCLSGADEETTLESLPSVIREAIDDGVLVITRRA